MAPDEPAKPAHNAEAHDHLAHGEPLIQHALHVPLAPTGGVLVLCHGANNDYTLPLLVQTASGAAAAGLYALRFNFAVAGAERNAPVGRADLPQACADLQQAIGYLRNQLGARRLYLAGKSFGAWAILETLVAGQRASGAVLWGLPLHGPGASPAPATIARVRDALRRVPALLVVGEHDALGSPDGVRETVAGLEDMRVHVVAGGDHSYRPVPGAPRTHDEMVAEAASVSVAWLAARA